jgi:dimethylhistidine N-methyltransferase
MDDLFLQTFRREVLAGLSQIPKKLLPKFFYDEAGCALFDQICQLEEYYPTRTEIEILTSNRLAISNKLGADCLLIGLGSGRGVKTRIILDCLKRPAAYVLVDLGPAYLKQCIEKLTRSYPDLPVFTVCADFTEEFTMPEIQAKVARIVAFFPGSTIGNLEPAVARRFLQNLRVLCGSEGGLLLGVDLKKDRDRLERAYNDSRGVTAAFNLNILNRINRAFGSNIRTSQFAHRAFYNEREGRIEMHLVSKSNQSFRLNGATINLSENEPVVTEHSYKYRVEEFAELAASADWQLDTCWTDSAQLFSVLYLRPF